MEIPVTLNVKSANVIPVINCMQGDTPTLVCTILNGDELFIADSGEFDLCVCEGETAKHKAISIKCAVNSNIVTVHLTKNETDEAGDLKLCISFSNTAQELVVSTFPFILKATENPAYSAVGQKENIKALTDYIAEAKKYAETAKDSGANISEYVDNAKKYAESASESVTSAENAEKLSQSYATGDSGVREGEAKDNAKYYSEKSAESEQGALEAAETARQKANEVVKVASEVSESATSVLEGAKKAEAAAKLSQSYSIGKSGIREGEDTDNAKYYYEQSKTNADTAVQSATNAATSESNANSYMESARQSADIAVQSAESAANSEGVAAEKASEAEQSATNAKQSETNIKKAEESSNTMAQTARSYAVGDTDFRENEATDNAKYYSYKAKEYAEQAQAVAGGDFISNTEKGIAGGVAVLNDALAVEKAVSDKNGNDISETYAEKTEVPSLIKVDGSTITKDKDGILHGSTSIDIDSELSDTSTNPVENKVITAKVNTIDQTITQLSTDKANKTDVANTYATKTEVPLLVKVDNKTVFISSDGTLSAKGGGSSIKPKPVSDVSIVSAKSKVTIKWTDPTDIVVDGATLSQWQKTVLMYKQGTVPPTSLNDGTIAVEETTRNQYQSTGYGISLTDGYDYSFSLFTISTDGTSSDKVSVSAKLYATLTVTTEETNLYGKVVTVTSGSQKVTGTFDDNGSVTLRIPWIGSTVVSSTDGTDTTTATVNIAEYGNSYNAELSFFKIVTFADGTDEEIMAMIEAHYNNKINIADYWAVGDKRKVNLSAMSATGVGESHRAQTVEFAIADFDHDDLTTAISGHTKAAVTLTQVDCLMDATSASNSNNGSADTEKGYMNSSNTNVGGWESCARRAWCNSVYYNALPSAFKNAVKEVNKKTLAGGGSSTIVTTADKVFLLSEIEIFGKNPYSVAGEGNQYPYYKNTTANSCKLPKWNSSHVSNLWWPRSPIANNDSFFCVVTDYGKYGISNSAQSYGIAPCLCI